MYIDKKLYSGYICMLRITSMMASNLHKFRYELTHSFKMEAIFLVYTQLLSPGVPSHMGLRY